MRTLLLVALVPWTTCFSWQETKQEVPKPVKVPFKLTIGQILLEVKVDDKGPLNFILDTGSNVTVIVPEAAEKHDFRNGDVVKLTMGDLTHKDQPIRVMKVFELSKAPKDIPPVHGILGSNFIENYLVTVDFKDSSVTFASLSDDETRKKEMDPKHTISVSITRNLPYGDIYINTQGPYSILLDTGSNLTAISKEIAKELGLKPEKGKRNPVADFGLKDHITENLQVVPTDPPAQGARSGKNGSVGNNYFCQFRTTFDLKKKEVCLVPNGYVPDYKDFVLPKK